MLSDLAAEGYRRFSAALAAATEQAGTDPRARMQAMGRAYVHFACAHPGLFVLMFRSERLDPERPGLRQAIGRAREALRDGVAAVAGPSKPLQPLDAAARGTAVWSLVHGFAVLLLDGRLRGTIATLPDGADAETLLEAVLTSIQVNG